MVHAAHLPTRNKSDRPPRQARAPHPISQGFPDSPRHSQTCDGSGAARRRIPEQVIGTEVSERGAAELTEYPIDLTLEES
jgi:hypothetical protein